MTFSKIIRWCVNPISKNSVIGKSAKFGTWECQNNDESLEKNRIMLEKEGRQAWNQREYKTLLLIKDYLEKK